MSLVFLGYPPRQAILILFNDFYAVIFSAAIDHNIFDVRIVLFQDRTDRCLEEEKKKRFTPAW